MFSIIDAVGNERFHFVVCKHTAYIQVPESALEATHSSSQLQALLHSNLEEKHATKKPLGSTNHLHLTEAFMVFSSSFCLDSGSV